MTLLEELVDKHLELVDLVDDLRKRFARSQINGKVAEVNHEEGWCRVNLGEGDDGKPMLSPKIPFYQKAGKIKDHVPVSEGQQVTLHAPGGDLESAYVVPFTWSNENKSPGNGPDPVWTYGKHKITRKEEESSHELGDLNVTLKAKGAVRHQVKKREWFVLKIDGQAYAIKPEALQLVDDI